MSAQDQVTIMSSRSSGGGGTSTSAARVILQTSGPVNKHAVQGPPPLTSIVLSTTAASKMLGNNDPSPSNKVAELSSTKHRVKQLLETYSMTAEKSLMGPEEAAYSKFDQSYSGMMVAICGQNSILSNILVYILVYILHGLHFVLPL